MTTAVKTWRYSIPNEKCQGWAILFLDSAGCFAVLSDYGNYAYRWNPRGFPEGDREDIRRFVTTCDDGYLLGKLSPRDEYDGEKTLASVKEHVLEHRRSACWDKERARKEWDLLDEHSGLQDERDFESWSAETSIEAAWELTCSSPPGQALAFMERAWPRLKAAVEAELAEEAAQAPKA